MRSEIGGRAGVMLEEALMQGVCHLPTGRELGEGVASAPRSNDEKFRICHNFPRCMFMPFLQAHGGWVWVWVRVTGWYFRRPPPPPYRP